MAWDVFIRASSSSIWNASHPPATEDASEIRAIAEPWFLAFNAGIEIHPVMRLEDLAKAGGAIETAVKKYA